MHNNNLHEAQDLFYALGPAAATIVATESCRNDLLLHRAVRCGWYPMAKFLIEQVLHQQINTPKKDGATPLFLASQEGHIDLVRLLIANGASLELSDEDGISPLYIASYQGHADVVEILLNAGADPNQLGKDSTSALYIAAQEGYAQIVQMLAERGANINAPDREGTTPLLMASQEGRTASVAVLLAHGADVEAATSRGVRPIHSASQNGHLKIIQMLTAYGCEVDVKTQSGTTAIRLGTDFGHDDICRWLLHCPEWTELDMCVHARLFWVAQRLLESGVADKYLNSQESILAVRHAAFTAGPYSDPVCPITAQLINRATIPWTPSNHFVFGPLFRSAVQTIMLVKGRLLLASRSPDHSLKPTLPYEMWLEIISHLARASFSLSTVLMNDEKDEPDGDIVDLRVIC